MVFEYWEEKLRLRVTSEEPLISFIVNLALNAVVDGRDKTIGGPGGATDRSLTLRLGYRPPLQPPVQLL